MPKLRRVSGQEAIRTLEVIKSKKESFLEDIGCR